MHGRRITERSRYRAGNLMTADGSGGTELVGAVDPVDPGTDAEAVPPEDEPLLGIGFGISIGL